MRTLEQYIKDNNENGIIDFSIRAGSSEHGSTMFYIHPTGIDGDTLDFEVQGNTLITHYDSKEGE